MADDKEDAVEITSICNGLVINIGTLNNSTIPTMFSTGKRANELSHPVILDPVGVGASKLRTDITFKLLEEVKFSVIRGNISEIKTISKGTGTTKGVDADASDAITENHLDKTIAWAKQNKRAVIAVPGLLICDRCQLPSFPTDIPRVQDLRHRTR